MIMWSSYNAVSNNRNRYASIFVHPIKSKKKIKSLRNGKFGAELTSRPTKGLVIVIVKSVSLYDRCTAEITEARAETETYNLYPAPTSTPLAV